jgi:hypothetical protein
MPGELTELTEIVTGLGMLSYESVGAATTQRPTRLVNVSDAQWSRLERTVADPRYEASVHSAWANGRAFLQARDGLRERPPLRIEWKGPQHPPGYDLLPADLRVDHVYLVSCKYLSRILMNAAPGHLFDRALAVREGSGRSDWYAEVAPIEYNALFAEVRSFLAEEQLPERREDLTRRDRDVIGAACAGQWPQELVDPARQLAGAVGNGSAERWRYQLSTVRDQELMLWRLLRFNSSPYFVLGAPTGRTLRLRIGTPWDWRQLYRLSSFQVSGSASAGQPRVEWTARVEKRDSREPVEVRGHVEVRWSHGKFCGSPEAKVYLDSPHEGVPGYFALT